MTTRGRVSAMTVPGPLLFARYAYPPNALGYCGPDDHLGLLEYASAGIADEGLRALALRFAGAWPYLRLIAAANGIADPLDARVVEAYWIGNPLLRRVDPGLLAAFLDETLAPRLGRRRSALSETARLGAVPHHNFHVFGVYPWVGLLKAGMTSEPMRVLEGCRIRWGTVEAVSGEVALVRSQPIAWNGRRLELGPERQEIVTWSVLGKSLARSPTPGDVVSMHWHWVCDRLTPRQATALRRYTARALALVNSHGELPSAAFA